MPKTKKEESSHSDSDSDSGPDDRTPAKKQKVEGKNSEKDANGDISWELDKNRFLKVREFKGKKLIDIREYYEKDGKTLPGKKGISLSLSQWKKLVEYVDEVNKEL